MRILTAPFQDSASQDTLSLSQSSRWTISTADSLNELCVNTWKRRTLALWYARKALTVSEKLIYLHGKGVALKNIGNVNLFLGNYDSAITCYHRAIDVFVFSNEEKGIAGCNNNIGMVLNTGI